MSLENSKAAHQLRVSSADGSAETPQIVRIVWVRNCVGGGDAAGIDAEAQRQPQSWRQILRSGSLGLETDGDGDVDVDVDADVNANVNVDGDADAELDEMAALDLPTELAFLDLDASLPKISPLPSGSAGTTR
jgi:hypothetical protein